MSESGGQVRDRGGSRLNRELSFIQQFALSVATVGPFIVIFGFYGGMAEPVGTGILYLLLVVGVLHLSNANVFAHMSSLFPRAGGGYAIVRATLGSFWGLIYLVVQVVYWAAVTATVVTLAASFLHSQFSGLPERATELVLVAIIFGFALSHVKESGRASSLILAFEGAFIVLWIVLALANVAVPLTHVFSIPPKHLADNGTFGGSVSFSAFIAAIPFGIFALSGYEWASSYTEEAKDFKSVRRALVMAAGAAVLACAIAMPLLTVADPQFQKVLGAQVPGAEVLKHVAPALAPVLIIYVAFSSWNAGMSNFLQAARVIFDAAREGEFGETIGRPLSRVSSSGAPVAASIVWLVPTLAFVLSSKLQEEFIFSAVMLLVAYMAMSLTASYFYLRVGRSAGERTGAFRWFPLVPAIVLGFCVLGLVKQPWSDVRTALWILLGAVVVGFLRHRSMAVNDASTIIANSRRAGSDMLSDPRLTVPATGAGDPAGEKLPA